MTSPLPAFNFMVQWGGTRTGFAEVSGLSEEIGVIEYREGADKSAAPMLVPGLKRPATVTLKRGILPADNELFAWFATVLAGKAERRNVAISLLDADHAPQTTWKLSNAWPSALATSDLDARANQIAIESLTVVCEGMTRESA